MTPPPRNEPAITPELIAEHGIAPDEYENILQLIGREPSFTELGIFSAMWNEHCSYKSSKLHLKTLSAEAPWVICGPGENAGIVDIGDGQAAVFKMESHNHPSYIAPYQGAATGVGGILRDVFTMGARPVASLNALRFGAPDHSRTRHLVGGVVAGIGGYGNAFGVPTVGGEVNFHPRYNGNILVNAMAVGLADIDRIFYSAASGVGNDIVCLGAKTGRDGIHGASMASREFGENSEEKRPTVQVGDPFTEKLLMEACLELMGTGAVVAIQDMGAAGLTCSAVEMGAKGDLGVELWLDKVPCREDGMTPYEMMLSESQERMLMVLAPGHADEARAIFEKYALDFTIVGKTTDTLRFVVKWHGDVFGDLPIRELDDEAPEYDRPWTEPVPPPPVTTTEAPADIGRAVLQILESANHGSRRWVWEQYDHLIQGNTIQRPGGDAGVIRIDGTSKALAVTSDVTPRYVEADPFEGGKQAVVEAWRNLTATGARPLAVTDNLNFGNPERPEIMGTLVKAIQGIGEACRTLNFPVVSGNVSLYNETRGRAILPTPTIGALGVIDDLARSATIGFKENDVHFLVLGGPTAGHLGQSTYLAEVEGREDGTPPPVDPALEQRAGDPVRGLIADGITTTCHDISDGGLAIALAEMCIAGGRGARVTSLPAEVPPHALLFGEDQARYVLGLDDDGLTEALNRAMQAGLAISLTGQVGGDELKFDDHFTISVKRLREAHESWFPEYMEGKD